MQCHDFLFLNSFNSICEGGWAAGSGFPSPFSDDLLVCLFVLLLLAVMLPHLTVGMFTPTLFSGCLSAGYHVAFINIELCNGQLLVNYL